jgi:hypothetical protein
MELKYLALSDCIFLIRAAYRGSRLDVASEKRSDIVPRLFSKIIIPLVSNSVAYYCTAQITEF